MSLQTANLLTVKAMSPAWKHWKLSYAKTQNILFYKYVTVQIHNRLYKYITYYTSI